MKAYLAWPVKLMGFGSDHHVTVKYLGPISELECVDMDCTDCDPIGDLIRELDRRLAGLETALDLRNVSVEPERWNGGRDHVLTLGQLWPEVFRVHEAVASLCKDSYPSWRPHITVAPYMRAHVAARKLRHALEVVETVGPLTLFVKSDDRGYLPVRVWR